MNFIYHGKTSRSYESLNFEFDTEKSAEPIAQQSHSRDGNGKQQDREKGIFWQEMLYPVDIHNFTNGFQI